MPVHSRHMGCHKINADLAVEDAGMNGFAVLLAGGFLFNAARTIDYGQLILVFQDDLIGYLPGYNLF